MNEQLSSYINNARQAGMSDEKITETLTAQGWDTKDIIPLLNVDADIPPELAPGQSSMVMGRLFSKLDLFFGIEGIQNSCIVFFGHVRPHSQYRALDQGRSEGEKNCLGKSGVAKF